MTIPQRLSGTALLLTLLLGASGCTDAATTDREPAFEQPTPVQLVGQSSPLVQRLWRPIETLPRLRTVLPSHLDTEAIEQAPSLSDAPINQAVIAVGTDPAPYFVGGVAVLSPDGAWRIIDRSRLGLRDPDHVEQQYMLSPDGRTLALGDRHGIVLVDLATAGSVRVPTDAYDVVLHAWTPDSSRLIFTPRSSSTKTFALDVAERSITRLEFRAWASSVGPEGQVVELMPPAATPRPRYSGMRMWQAGRPTGVVPLGVRLPQYPTVGRQWGPFLPVLQTGRWSTATGPARGVLAIDPLSGEGVGLLALGLEQAPWTSMRGFTADGWLLLCIGNGPGGGLVAWDPVGQKLRAIMTFDEQATSVSVATDILRSDHGR